MNTQNLHFLIMLLPFTIIYVTEVIYIYCICMVEILYNGMLPHISSQLCV